MKRKGLQLRRYQHNGAIKIALFDGDYLVNGQVRVCKKSVADGLDTVTVKFFCDNRLDDVVQDLTHESIRS